MKSAALLLPAVFATLLVSVNCAYATDQIDADTSRNAATAAYNTATTRFWDMNVAMTDDQARYYELSAVALEAYQANVITAAHYNDIEDMLECANNDVIEIGGLLNSVNILPDWSVRDKKLSAAAHLGNANNYCGVSNWDASIAESNACISDVSSMNSGMNVINGVLNRLEGILDEIDEMIPPWGA